MNNIYGMVYIMGKHKKVKKSKKPRSGGLPKIYIDSKTGKRYVRLVIRRSGFLKVCHLVKL